MSTHRKRTLLGFCLLGLLFLAGLPTGETQLQRARVAIAGTYIPSGWSAWTKMRAYANAYGVDLIRVYSVFDEYVRGHFNGVVYFPGDREPLAPVRDALEKRGGRAVIIVSYENDCQEVFGIGVASEAVMREPYKLAGEQVWSIWNGLTIGMHTSHWGRVGIDKFLVPRPNDPRISVLGSIPSQQVPGRQRTISCRVKLSEEASVVILTLPSGGFFFGADPFIEQYDNEEATRRMISWLAGKL